MTSHEKQTPRPAVAPKPALDRSNSFTVTGTGPHPLDGKFDLLVDRNGRSVVTLLGVTRSELTHLQETIGRMLA